MRFEQRMGWLVSLLLVGSAALTAQADVTINNGSAPPDPANVIDDATYAAELVHIRNENCLPPPPFECSEPGDPTLVHMLSGADVQSMVIYDSSAAALFAGASLGSIDVGNHGTFTMSGGSLGSSDQYGSGKVFISGGDVTGSTEVLFFAEIEISGGTLQSMLLQYGSQGRIEGGVVNEIDVYGSDLALSAGTILDGLMIGADSTLVMTGGSVSGPFSSVGAASVTLAGGTVTGAHLCSNGPCTWSGTEIAQTGIAFGADVQFTGGSIGGTLLASNAAHVDWSGGTVGSLVDVRDTSLVVVHGSGFEVDGQPVPYGDLAATSGLLTGTLANGDPLSVSFLQGDAGGSSSGTLRLAPPATAVPALGPAGSLVLVAALLSCVATARAGLRARA